jgi:hypothetical protein
VQNVLINISRARANSIPGTNGDSFSVGQLAVAFM